MATSNAPESIPPPSDPEPEPVAIEPVPEPIPEPIVVTDPVPEPVADLGTTLVVENITPEPVVEPAIIEPSPESVQVPVIAAEPSPEPVAAVTEPVPEPIIVDEPVPEPVVAAEPVPEPVAVLTEPFPEPVVAAEPVPEPVAVVTEPVPEPVAVVTEPVPEPVAVVTELVPEPVAVVTEPVPEPIIVAEPVPEPVAVVTEPVPEPIIVDEPVPEPVVAAEPVPEPVQEPVIFVEPTSDVIVVEPSPEPIVEPVPEQVVVAETPQGPIASEQGVEIVEPLILDNSNINELVEQVGDLIDKVHEEISFDIKADEHENVLEDTAEPAPELEPVIDIDKFADTDVYYINLDKSTHRRQLMEKEFAREKINARRFSAVNGHTIDKSDIARYQKAKILTDPRWGTLQKSPNISRLGIHLSHFGVWRHFQNASGKKYLLVFEDDVKLAKGFKSLFNDALSKAPNDWEMLFLSSAEDVYGTPVNRFFVSPQPGQRPRANHGLFCYVLKRTTIDKMIKLTIPVSFKLPHIDHVIREYYGGTLKAYYLAPQYRIAKHRDELISDRDGKQVNSIPVQMQKTIVPSTTQQRSVPSLVGAKPVAKPPPRITAPPTVYGNWGAPTSAPAPRETYKPVKRI